MTFKPTKALHLAVALTMAISANGVLAQSSADSLVPAKSYELQPVTVISVHQLPDPGKLELNSSDRLAHDGGALLNANPVINSIRKGGNYGFDPVLRGFKYDQLNIVLDGVQTAAAACPNRMDPATSQMAPNMLSHIEIVKGPHALRYGTGFGGTINFRTSATDFTAEEKGFGRLTAGYESNGSLLRSEGMAGFSTQKLNVRFFGSWSQGNDYVDGNGNTVPSSFTRGSFGAQLKLKLTDHHTAEAIVTRNLARDADFATLPMDLRSDDTWMLQAKHVWTAESGNLKAWNTSVFATLVDHVMDNYDKEIEPRMVDAITYAESNTYGFRTEGDWRFEHAGHLYAGADLKGENVAGSRERTFLMGPNMGKTVVDNAWQDGRIERWGVFGEYHTPLGRFDVVASGRVEYNVATAGDPADEFTSVSSDLESTQVNPSFSIGAGTPVAEHWLMSLWLGRAQRSASITERYINYFPVGQDPYEMLGNPELKQEVNQQADLQFKYTRAKTMIEFDVFASIINDYITSRIDTSLTPRMPTSPGVRQYVNLDQAFLTGFEVSWNQRFGDHLGHQFAAAYTYGQDLGREEALPEIAPLDLRYALQGYLMANSLRPEVAVRYVAAQDRVSQEFGENTSPAFTTVDLNVTYQPINQLSLGLGVRNVFDVAYYEHLNRSVRALGTPPLYAPGRYIVLSVTWRMGA